jgi:hypothetical protein
MILKHAEIPRNLWGCKHFQSTNLQAEIAMHVNAPLPLVSFPEMNIGVGQKSTKRLQNTWSRAIFAVAPT